jgi:hypothetical protein
MVWASSVDVDWAVAGILAPSMMADRAPTNEDSILFMVIAPRMSGYLSRVI